MGSNPRDERGSLFKYSGLLQRQAGHGKGTNEREHMKEIIEYIKKDLHLLTHWNHRVIDEVTRRKGIVYRRMECNCGKVFYNDFKENSRRVKHLIDG